MEKQNDNDHLWPLIEPQGGNGWAPTVASTSSNYYASSILMTDGGIAWIYVVVWCIVVALLLGPWLVMGWLDPHEFFGQPALLGGGWIEMSQNYQVWFRWHLLVPIDWLNGAQGSASKMR